MRSAEKPLPQKIAIVVQRFGHDVVGGAEAHARILAQKLKNTLHYDIDVFTTTAKDYQTWSNYYSAGESYAEGIRVYRFPVSFGRAPLFGMADRVLRKIMRPLRRFTFLDGVTKVLEWLWVYLQGPVSPKLAQELRRQQHAYQKIIFFCYLYYPTLVGSIGLEHKAILIPLAHDEPPFHFKIVRDLLRRIPQMIPNTEPEWELIKRTLDQKGLPVAVPAGLGFERPDAEAPLRKIEGTALHDLFAQQIKYALYLGRISAGKGAQELIQWFVEWKDSHPENCLSLVLAGHREDSVTIPSRDDVVYLGFVSDDERDVLIANCQFLINLSIHESLSMIVIEALVAGKPVIAHRACEVFRFYAQNAPGVLLAGSFSEFSEHINRLLVTDSVTLNHMSEASRSWAQHRFSWAQILETFRGQIES